MVLTKVSLMLLTEETHKIVFLDELQRKSEVAGGGAGGEVDSLSKNKECLIFLKLRIRKEVKR